MVYHYNKTVKERLEGLSIPEPNSGCWLWIGAVNEWGYGTIRIARKTVLAHRASWMETNGPIPDGLIVCHSCDIPACINPDHLWLGTNQDNSDDCLSKGRNGQLAGELHCSAALLEKEVKEIIRLLSLGIKPKKLSETYGCSRNSIYMIKYNRTWRHLARE